MMATGGAFISNNSKKISIFEQIRAKTSKYQARKQSQETTQQQGVGLAKQQAATRLHVEPLFQLRKTTTEREFSDLLRIYKCADAVPGEA